MSETNPFDLPDFERVRVRLDDQDNPWWVAFDACQALGILNSMHQCLEDLDRGEKGFTFVECLGEERMTPIVNKSGLWKLVSRSREAEAKRRPSRPASEKESA